MKQYLIPEDELERLLLSCASDNNCLDKDNKVKDSCVCYQQYAKELTKELLDGRNSI